MQSSELIKFLREIFPSTDSKNVISALRQDPLVWNCLLDESIFKVVKEKAERNEDVWRPFALALIALDQEVNFIQNDAFPLINKETETKSVALQQYQEVLASHEIPSTLKQAGLLAIGMNERHSQGSTWAEIAREITPKSSMTYEHAVRLWRTPLAILFGMVSDRMAFLQALLPERGSKTSIEWISHIILSNPMDHQDQVKILFVLMAHLPLGSRVGWLIILNRLGKKELVIDLSKMILAARAQSSESATSDAPSFQNDDDLAVHVVESQYLATLQQLAENPQEAKDLVNRASEHLKEWMHNLDQLKKGLDEKNGVGTILDSPILDDENPVLQIMKTGSLRAEPNSRHEKIHDAAIRLIDLIKSDPASIFPRYALGWEPGQIINKLESLGFHREAMECITGFIELRPTDTTLIADAVTLFSKMENYSKAVEYASLLVLLDPENLAWRRLLAEQYSLNGDLVLAMEEQQDILAKDPLPEISDWLKMADLAIRAGNQEKAKDACNAVLAAEPENALALGYLGKLLIDNGDLDQAIQYLSRATLIAPEMDLPWLNLVDALKRKNEPEKAFDSLRSAVLASPNSALINHELAKTCLERGAKAEALPYLRKAAKLSPNSLPVVLELVKALGELGHSSDAKEIIEASREKWPGQPDLAYAHAGILQADGDFDSAIRAYETAIAGKPDEIQWIIGYAESLLGDNGDFVLGKNKILSQSALRSALDAILRSANIPVLKRNILLAELHLALGDYGDAFEIYEKLVEIQGDSQDGWRWRIQTGLARAASALNKPDLALVALTEALKEKPDLKELYEMKAEAALAAELPNEAETAADHALEMDPEQIDAIIWHAEMMMKLGKSEKAYHSLSKALEIAPERTDLLVKLAEVQYSNGKQDESRKELEEILDLGCTDQGDLEEGARIALDIGDQKLALSFLERAIALKEGVDSGSLMVLAGLYKKLGDLPSALREIQKAIQSNPENASLYLSQADILHDLGDTQAALSSLDQASKTLLSSSHSGQSLIMTDKMGQLIPDEWKGIPDPAVISSRQMKYYQELGNLSAAFSSAENTLKENPGDFNLRIQLIRMAFEALLDQQVLDLSDITNLSADHEASKDIAIDQIKEIYPALTCLRANILIEAGDIQQANRLIESIESISAESPLYQITNARIQKYLGQINKATSIFEKFLMEGAIRNPEKTDIVSSLIKELECYWMAETALDLAQWKRADSFFDDYRQAFPDSPRAHFGRAKFMTLAAEFQGLANELRIDIHSPKGVLQQFGSWEEFSEEMSLADQRLPSPLLVRWKARGRAVLNPEVSAIKELAALPKHPQDAAALIASLRDTKNLQAALQVAQKFPENANVLAQLALNIAGTNPESAMKAIEEVLNLEQDSPVFLALAAKIAEKCGDQAKSADYLSKALAIWPDEAEWQAWAARLYDELGQFDKSVHHWEQVMVLEPDDLTPTIALGEIYLRMKEYDKAAVVLENAKKIDPNCMDIYLALAEAYLNMERYQLALDNATSAGQLDNKSAEPLITCGKISKEMKDLKKAQDFAESALKRQPEDTNAILFAAEIMEESKGPNAALTLLEDMVASGNRSNGIQIARSALLRKSGKKADAFTEIKKLAMDDSDDPEILAELAKSQADMGYLLDAMDTASKVLKVDPENAEMHLLIGTHQGRAGQLDLAIHHLIEAVKLNPKAIDAYLELGEMYQQRREFNQARKVYQDAIKANPKEPRLHFQLGLALKEAKDFAGSEAMLRKAAELDPLDIKIRRQLGAVIALNLVQNAQEVSQVS